MSGTTRKRYSDDFKKMVVELAASSDKRIIDIERRLDITPGLIYKWRQQLKEKAALIQEAPEPSLDADKLSIRYYYVPPSDKKIKQFAREVCQKTGTTDREIVDGFAKFMKRAVTILCKYHNRQNGFDV